MMKNLEYKKIRLWVLILISLVEGGSLMAVELISVKLIAPYYGNSLYVWSAVLAITMSGLTIGYYIGGYISDKYPNLFTLNYILLFSAIFTAFLPFSSEIILNATNGYEIKTGIIISAFTFIFPPLICFGMIPPIIIRLIAIDLEKVGQAVGLIYSVSTIGGIIATFSFGFYLIPFKGLIFCSLMLSFFLAIFPFFFFIKVKGIIAKIV